MSNVFVVDTYERPLDPVHPGRARMLLKQGKAAVWRHFPFTLIVKTEVKEPVVHPLRLKLDPGSKTKGVKKVQGFQTGDIIKAVVPKGAKQGTYTGKVAIRATGSFNITTATQTIEGIHACYCHAIHRCDGYRYGHGEGALPSSSKKGGPLSSLA